MRSQTFIEPHKTLSKKYMISPNIPRSKTGLPLISTEQRHLFSLLRMRDLFSYGDNEEIRPCATAKRLCHILVDFAVMVTSAKRQILEQPENYYKTVVDGKGNRKQVAMNRNQQRLCRKRVIETDTFTGLPGKLDHATCVAWCVPHIKTDELTSQSNTKLSIHSSNVTETCF